MNTLSNIDNYFIPNTLDGINIIQENINDNALLVDGTNQMLADLNAGGFNIKNLDAGIANDEAVNVGQLNNKLLNYVDLTSTQTIGGLKTFSNQVTFNGTTKTNLTLDDIPDTANRVALSTSGTQTLTGTKTWSNSATFNGPTFTRGGTDTNINSTNLTTSSTTITNLNHVCNTKNLVVTPKQETYGTGGGGSGTRYNYVRFNFNNADGGGAAGRQWCISPQEDSGTINSNDLILRCGSGGTDGTRVIFGYTRNYFAQNVGIGTSSPSQLLDVNGASIFRGSLNMNSTNKITNLADPTLAQDGATKNYVDTSLNLLRAYVDSQDTADRAYVDASVNALKTYTDSSLNLLRAYVDSQDVADRAYVDASVNALKTYTDSSLNLLRAYVDNQDVADRAYVDASLNLKVNRAGDVMTGTLSINKDATNNNTSYTETTAYLDLTSGTIYNEYTLTYNGSVEIWLPYTSSGVATLQNKSLQFNVSANTTAKVKPKQHINYTATDSSCNINGTTYFDYAGTPNPPYTSLDFVATSFSLQGSNTIGTYTTGIFQDLNNTDQLTIKSSLGTNAESEFTGIKFLNTTTDAGIIRCETDKAHANSTMRLYTRSSNATILPLEIGNTIYAYRPIVRNMWSSGELIQTKIYNQDTNGTGVLQINAGSGATTWKSVTFTMLNSVTDSYLCVEVFAPYHLSGAGQDRVLAQIRDFTSSTEDEALLTGQYWDGNGGGGTRSGIILPMMASFTPTLNTSNKTRTIEVRFNNYTNDTLYICRIVNAANIIADCNYYTIKISEYKK